MRHRINISSSWDISNWDKILYNGDRKNIFKINIREGTSWDIFLFFFRKLIELRQPLELGQHSTLCPNFKISHLNFLCGVNRNSLSLFLSQIFLLKYTVDIFKSMHVPNVKFCWVRKIVLEWSWRKFLDFISTISHQRFLRTFF